MRPWERLCRARERAAMRYYLAMDGIPSPTQPRTDRQSEAARMAWITCERALGAAWRRYIKALHAAHGMGKGRVPMM